MTDETETALPLSFRATVARQVMDAIRAGESCALVGVGSSGKSNLLRFLARPDVQAEYLGSAWAPRLLVLVDGDGLGEDTEDGVYRLLLDSLMNSLAVQASALSESMDWPAYLQELDKLAESGQVRGAFNRTVAFLRARGLHLAFLLDNFDDALARCDAAVFAGLRALRNEHKYQLVYVTATRRALNHLGGEALRFETFAELFTQNTVYLGPYSPEDARLMLARLAARFQTSLSPEEAERLAWASGGHAGLLRAAFAVVRGAAAPLSRQLLLQRLGQDRGVREECQKILNSLESDERASLESILVGALDRTKAARELLARGLLVQKGTGQFEPAIPVLRDFILATTKRNRLLEDDLDLYG